MSIIAPAAPTRLSGFEGTIGRGVDGRACAAVHGGVTDAGDRPEGQRIVTPLPAAGVTRSNRTLLSQPGRSLSTYSSPFTSAPNAVGWVGKVPISADS